MSANVEAMVREGINAFKTGRKDEARALLLKATELDQFNEQAWLWLSGIMDSEEDQRTCLENVLAINPENERAKQGLSYLTGQTSTGNISPFSAASPPPSGMPPSSSPPSSVEWGMPDEPTPSVSAWAPPPQPVEPSPDVLDDWVSNLNLPANDVGGSSAGMFSGMDADSGESSPFGDFDLDEDIFAGGPFSAPPASNAAPSRTPQRSASSPRTSPVPSSSPRRETRPRDTGPLLDDTENDDALIEPEEDGMFGYIPSEIPATRLPGTRERTPILLTLAIILLVVVNIGVGSFVMLSLFS